MSYAFDILGAAWELLRQKLPPEHVSVVVKIVNALSVIGALIGAMRGNWIAAIWALNTLLWCSYAGMLEAKLAKATGEQP